MKKNQNKNFEIKIVYQGRLEEIYIPTSQYCLEAENPHILGLIIQYNMEAAVVTYGRNVTDKVTVSAYEPLVVIHPLKAETVLAVGSSRNIIFRSGSQPCFGVRTAYRRDAYVSDNRILEVAEQESVNEGDIFEFKVLCKALGV